MPEEFAPELFMDEVEMNEESYYYELEAELQAWRHGLDTDYQSYGG